jgi:hypothetical protein
MVDTEAETRGADPVRQPRLHLLPDPHYARHGRRTSRPGPPLCSTDRPRQTPVTQFP